MPVNMRSVWSRVGAGSETQVLPSAYRPASNRLDFTWALATGMLYSIPVSVAPPCICSGAVHVSVVSISAPMETSGPTTRFIGRPDNDVSPVSVVEKDCPASRPDISRMEVPEFPRYKSPAGACSPRRPTPSISTLPLSGPLMLTPMARKADRVARLSSPSRKPLTSVLPSAREPSMMERCEMDLSPGTRNCPVSFPPGTTLKRISSESVISISQYSGHAHAWQR